MTRRTRLDVTRFEDRVTPVTGPFDPPFVLSPGDALGANTVSGIGEFNPQNSGAGRLIDRGGVTAGTRFLLTSGTNPPPVGSPVDFRLALPDGTIQTITIPVAAVTLNNAAGGLPGGPGNLAVVTLAAVAPFGATALPIYTSAQAAATPEVGLATVTYSRGSPGTGTSGAAVAAGGLRELQRLTITATGGSFALTRTDTGATSALFIDPAVNANQTAAQVAANLAAALAQIGYGGAAVTPVVLTPAPLGPNQTQYEVLFPVAAGNATRLSSTSNPADPLVNGGAFGTVATQTLANGARVEFQRLAVTATGGTYRLGFGNVFTSPLAATATAAQVEAALTALPGLGGEVTVRPVNNGPGAGTLEIQFDQIGFDIPNLTVDSAGLTGGTATAVALADGGTDALRAGSNEFDRIVNDTLQVDMDPDGTDGLAIGFAPYLLDTGGGRFALAAVGTGAGTTTFGSQIFPVRVSTYSGFIQSVTDAGGASVLLDMNAQLVGNDGVPNIITVRQTGGGSRLEVWVQNGPTDTPRLYYADTAGLIDSLRITGTADDDTFVIDPSVTRAVRVDGGFGTDTVVGPGAATAWALTAPNTGTARSAPLDFDFQGVENLIGGGGNDTFTFAAAATLSGTLDGGGGADTVDFSGRAGTTVRLTGTGTADGFRGTAAPITGGFDNVDGAAGNPAAGTDVLVTPDTAGVFAHAGAAGSYTNTPSARVLTYANFDVLTGGAAVDTFNVRSTTAALTIDGGGGADVVTVAGDAPGSAADGAVGGPFNLVGRGGGLTARINGTAADETVVARVTGPQAGDLQGLAQPVTFAGVTQVVVDGRGGTNSFAAQDTSNTSLGAPTDPGSGVVYYPTGATGGNARINGVTVGATGINNGFTVNGDPDGSGDTDVLLVVGTSAAGLQSAFGEAVVGDGRDRITVSDTTVTFQSVTGGALLPVRIGTTPTGMQAFSTLYVAGGNERGGEGDSFTVPTTLTYNLVVDGMLPSPSSRPGDRVAVTAPGGSDAQLVNDPNLGPTQTRVTARADASSAGLIGFESGGPAVSGAGMVAVGTDAGTPSTVKVFDRATGDFRYQVTPFDDFSDGVKVASGDVNADGIADLVVGAGPGGGPRVAVFDGASGGLLFDFFGYEDTFRGGVTVAVGDVNLDGFGDLILGTGVGGGPRVRVLSGRDLSPIRDLFAYESTFRGGVSVAAGDVNGDGVPDLVTSTGVGGGPRVVVLDGRTSASIASFFVFDQNSRAGFFAAAGDVNGDGFADIVAGSGGGPAARVRVFNGFNRAVLNDFFINNPFNPTAATTGITAGVRVAVADIDGDGIGDIVTGLGPGGDATVRTYKVTGVIPPTNALFPTLQEVRRQDAFDAGFGFGVFVGASN